MSRTHCQNRCARCRMRVPLCLCSEIPLLRLETRVVVLMHYLEDRTTTNTGRLATLALEQGEVRLRGLPDRPMSTEGLVPGEGQALLLYPSPDSVELNASMADGLARPVTLIVPDGSWRQAQKVPLRERALDGIPRVRVAPGPASVYRLRKEHRPDGLSTIEAIARALEVLEGPEARTALDGLLERMVRRTLWSRGLLSDEEAAGWIPEAAIRSRR